MRLEWRTARKVYRCSGGCDRQILPGQRYLRAYWHSDILIMPHILCRKCGEEFEQERGNKVDEEKILNWLKQAKPPMGLFMISAGQCYEELGYGEYRQKKETHPSGTLKEFREWYRQYWKPTIEKLTYDDYRKIGLQSPSGRRGLSGVFYFGVDPQSSRRETKLRKEL